MSTKHSSFIPMAPEHRPQQRLNEVVSVPQPEFCGGALGL